MFCGKQQRYTNVEQTIRIWSAIDADQHWKHLIAIARHSKRSANFSGPITKGSLLAGYLEFYTSSEGTWIHRYLYIYIYIYIYIYKF
jgi:hypothetical protein